MITRPDFDDLGGRMAHCERCGMGWYEWREPVELLPGWHTIAGERNHECPAPLPYEVARMLADTAVAAGGIVVSQRQKAAVKLGLEAGPKT